MLRFVSYLLVLLVGCQHAGGNKVLVKSLPPASEPVAVADTASFPHYSKIEYEKVEVLHAAPGTKSVLFNSTGTRLYAMNLEGMSIYEFDRASRKLLREFKFRPTRGTGWDYARNRPIPSYQEKPVEACLSHDDRMLWVSLHNADGIVPIPLDRNPGIQKPDHPSKKITVTYAGSGRVDSLYVPLIKTGKTPKVIARTADSRHLLVSNWHSYNVSVLELDENKYPYARVIGTIPVSSIPRGIAVDDRSGKSYVAIMGGTSVAVILNSVWMKEKDLPVASNPRHIVTDSSGRLFVSFNNLARVACIDPVTGKTLFSAPTHAQPRTIMLSKNQKFLFVTCYSSDKVDVFQINSGGFSKITSLSCKGHPVGVDIFEDRNRLEAWVCSYSNGSISVYSFKKK